jgi:hypothetical protein
LQDLDGQLTIWRERVVPRATLSLQEGGDENSQYRQPEFRSLPKPAYLVEGANRRFLKQILGATLIQREAQCRRV